MWYGPYNYTVYGAISCLAAVVGTSSNWGFTDFSTLGCDPFSLKVSIGCLLDSLRDAHALMVYLVQHSVFLGAYPFPMQFAVYRVQSGRYLSPIRILFGACFKATPSHKTSHERAMREWKWNPIRSLPYNLDNSGPRPLSLWGLTYSTMVPHKAYQV